ncbi:MAG TPA: hypothetical protein VEV81_01880 [Pyrinomonadaceae bacterium]|nr:hypothetical protein [Pyrinomonadaceae bacterium]
MNEVARNYKEKKFAEAEQHAKRALELDPDNESAPLFIARTIHAQFRRGDTSEANLAKANEAIEAYKKIAEKDPNNDEAFSAVTVLLGQLDKPDEQVKWVEQRANNEKVSADRRSDAYAFLASKDWDCSFKVTDDRANKQTVEKNGVPVIQFIKPKDPGVYDGAVRCMTAGLEKTEKALSLNNDNEKAWGQKYNLLLEAKKLAQMSEDTAKAAEYAKQAEQAAQRTKELNDKKKAAQTPQPAAAG